MNIDAHYNSPLVVYTAITNHRDTLLEPEYIPSNTTFVCFTDMPVTSKHWEIRPVKHYSKDVRRTARWYKANSHILFPESSYTCWIDGSIIVKEDIRSMLSLVESGNLIASHIHPQRNCLYAEALRCLELRLDNKKVLLEAISRYKNHGFGNNQGLYETPVILRKTSEKIAVFNEIWWQEIDTGSCRDQISFPYALHVADLKCSILPGNLTVEPLSPFFYLKKHHYLPHQSFKFRYLIHSIKIKIYSFLGIVCYTKPK